MGVSLLVLTVQITALVAVACLTSSLWRGGSSPPPGSSNGRRWFPLHRRHQVSRSPPPGSSNGRRWFPLHRRHQVSRQPVRAFSIHRDDRQEPGESSLSLTDGVAHGKTRQGPNPSPDLSARGRHHWDEIRSRRHEADRFGDDVKAVHFGDDVKTNPNPIPLHNCKWHDYKRARTENRHGFPTHDGLPAGGLQGEQAASAVPCGDGLCMCYTLTADCSSQAGRLTYIPPLPYNIRLLNVSNNDLRMVAADTFFDNATQITGLDLSGNNLAYFSPGAFKMLGSLQTLYLGHNPLLTFSSLAPVLSMPTLMWLDINDNDLGSLPADLFRRFPLPALVNLNLDGNGMDTVDMSVLSHLHSLQFLELSDNLISTLANFSAVSQVQGINLERNRLIHFPETCFNGESLFPRLENLELDGNLITAVPSSVCLPKLRYLSLRHNLIIRVGSRAFNQRLFPSLNELCFDYMPSLQTIQAEAFSNPNLLLLSLRWNDMLTFDSRMLDGCTNLTYLSMGYNFFVDSDLQRLVGRLKSLRVLDLESNFLHLPQFSCHAFDEFKHLSHLRLSGNMVRSLPVACFDRLPALTSLALNGNNIATVNETAFSAETLEERLHFLDLSENPFNCDEKLSWLCGWMISSPRLFANHCNMMCFNGPNTTVLLFCLERMGTLPGSQVN